MWESRSKACWLRFSSFSPNSITPPVGYSFNIRVSRQPESDLKTSVSCFPSLCFPSLDTSEIASSEKRYRLLALSGIATSGEPAAAHSGPPSRRNDFSSTVCGERTNSTWIFPFVICQPAGDFVMDTWALAKYAVERPKKATSSEGLINHILRFGVAKVESRDKRRHHDTERV